MSGSNDATCDMRTPFTSGSCVELRLGPDPERAEEVAPALLDSGHDINKTEPIADKGSSAWGPIHWAAAKGHAPVLEMLIRRGANVLVKDKHGSLAKNIAEKKGLAEMVSMLEAAEGSGSQSTSTAKNKEASVQHSFSKKKA